jgi:serine/threonine protein kinase
MQMTPNDWDRAKELFDAALYLEPSQRASFLAENCRDESLRQQVEKLLINYQEAGNFLDDPILNPSMAAPSTPVGNQSEEALRLRPQSGDPLATATSAEADDPMVGRQLGAYKLVRRIGQGGMAAVFLASRADDEYRKLVAVKLVKPGLDSRDLLNRFRHERQTLASLDHPNVVKLLDGGSTSDGLPFLVMDYVEGSPIDEYCDQHKLSVDDRLHLFRKVCDAVQYAHQKLVVHRDLKPSNILVVADGTPKLLDFGIAKVLNSEPSAQGLLVTQTGTRCMTPAYASPEQMRGNAVTPATDIYSLGVVLYELLSGHRPYRLTQHTPAEIERAICEQEPETPSKAISRVETDTSSDGTPIKKTPELVSQTRGGQPDKLRRRLRGDLDNIVLKTLQKEPQRRYDSVDAFSQDIGRHLQHLPIKARPSTFAYRASKFVQRHKIEVSAAGIVVLVLVTATALALNALGLRDRILSGVFGGRIQSRNAASHFKPKGWISAGAAGATPVVSCESLAELKLPDTTITTSQAVAEGNFTPASADPVQNLPPFCRVEGAIKPTKDSDIHFEVWLPSADWNGEFRAVGNGGFGGVINFGDMAAAARHGYATASTDTGHRGEDDSDASWALDHPEKVADWGYRSIHELTVKAKAIIRAFYGQAPHWSFFEGCSTGGRQGLMEAQRFPEDYDGILAGAPDYPWTLLAPVFYNTQVPGLTNPASYIAASKIPAISAAVLAACDAQDGLTDGILDDPRQCHFKPSVLLCQGRESDNCLTSAQVAQLKRIYAGVRNLRGEQILPGYLPGGEEGEDGWKGWITGSGLGKSYLSVIGESYLKNMVFGNPTWDYRTVSMERAIQMADAKTARVVNATDLNLGPFRARGGKLILYHGWSDAAVPGPVIVNYYNGVAGRLGLPETDSFVRLYMTPGMQHCYEGPGPNFFGQFDLSTLGPAAQRLSTGMDPQHNIFSALKQWVEKGIAPGSIVATKYVNDLDPSQGIKMTRPLCPYPQIAKYKGSGNTNDAANFVCSRTQ